MKLTCPLLEGEHVRLEPLEWRFSILAGEWPAVKERLRERLAADGARPLTATVG